MSHNLQFAQRVSYAGKTGKYYSLPAHEQADWERFPGCRAALRVVLETALRNYDGKKITETTCATSVRGNPGAAQ